MVRPERQALRLVEAEWERIAQARAKAPYADPATRDAEAMARAAKERLREEQRGQERIAAEATAKAQAMRAAVPFLIRPFIALGVGENARRVKEGDALAKRLANTAEFGRLTRDDLREAADQARRLAEHAQRVHRTWCRGEGAALDNQELALNAISARLDAGKVELAEAINRHGLPAILQATLRPIKGEGAEHLRVPRPADEGIAPVPWTI